MTSTLRPSRIATAAAVAVALFAVGACSGDDSSKPKPSATPISGSATPSSSAPKPSVDPLTGGKPSANGVVAVKIDDTGNGRPQRNIDKADVVYIEEVEGGLTRLLAVFHSKLPTVEAVRSTRAADPEILAQYGRIAYVASGGARNPLSILDKSPLKTTINDRNGPGFQRDNNRIPPYNLTADLARISRVLKPVGAKNVGFSWSYSMSQLSGAAAGTSIRTMVGGTPVEFRYNATTHRYVRYIDGVAQRTAAGVLISTTNVVVQFCKVLPYLKDRDVNGNPNAFTYTVGKGTIAVFRDGKRLAGTWSRATATDPTTLRTSSGQSLVLRPGNVWMVLTKTGTALR